MGLCLTTALQQRSTEAVFRIHSARTHAKRQQEGPPLAATGATHRPDHAMAFGDMEAREAGKALHAKGAGGHRSEVVMWQLQGATPQLAEAAVSVLWRSPGTAGRREGGAATGHGDQGTCPGEAGAVWQAAGGFLLKSGPSFAPWT